MVARAEAAAETKERILAAAWRAFADHAYELVRLPDVAREAGVTAQTVHSAFGTKDALFVAAWRWFVRPMGARRDGVIVGDVAAAIRALYDDYERDGDAVLRLMVQEERIPAVREMVDSGRTYHRDWIATKFAPFLSTLGPRARMRRHAALIAVTDLLVWKLLRRDMGLGRKQAERIVEEMVTAFKGAD